MTAVNSTMMALGSPAPKFKLTSTDGAVVSIDEFAGQPLLVAFICNHCPYVKHVAAQLKRMADDYIGKMQTIAINSNDVQAYPDDAPELMKVEKQERGYAFPYLFDACLLYTSPSPRDATLSRMPSSA